MKQTLTFHSRSAVVILVTLLYIIQKLGGNEASVQFHQQSVEEKHVPNEQVPEKVQQLEKPKDQKLIVRLPSNSLLKYTSYKDVSILHFRVPHDTRDAYFTFKAFEESKSAFQRHCKPKDVTLHLKANSFPVISPENITFPKNFIGSEQRFKIYDLQFLSDEQQHRIDIQGPEIGSWFAVAFVSWTDPNNERIEQQGLSASCDTVLMAELSVSRVYPIIMNDGKVDNANLSGSPVPHSISKRVEEAADATKKYRREQQVHVANLHNASPIPNSTAKMHSPKGRSGGRADSGSNSTTNNEVIYKFFAPDDVAEATARIFFAEVCAHCPNVSFHVKANAFPASCSEEEQSWDGNEHNYFHSTVISPNQTEEISIEFYVQPNTWHYVRLRFAEASDEFCLGLRPIKLTADEVTVAMDGIRDTKNETYNVSFALQIEFNQQAEEAQNESVPTQSHSPTQTQTPSPSPSPSQSQTASLSEPSTSAWQPVRFRGMDFYSLLRQSYHEFFMFDYDLHPDVNGTVPVLLNLTAHSAAGFAFELGEVYDIGGTLTFAVSMKHEMRFSSELKPPPPTTAPASERGGILAEKLVGGQNEASVVTGLEKTSRTNQSMQIIVCMHLNEPGAPTWPDKCRYGQRLLPASIIVNNTDLMGLVHVPFPESGNWYVTMGLYCHGAGTARVTIIDSVKEFVRQHVSMLPLMRAPCACAANSIWYEICIASRECLAHMNETETLRVKECMMDFKCTPDYEQMTRRFEIHYKSATEQHFAMDNCNTSVIFSVSSSPCVSGRCGRFGRCYHYMSGGFVFSTCVCMKGYRGWDCTEDSEVPSSISILMASLLLTLSNLLFIPSVYMAFRRYYYTESIIYFFAMFFSIFYHACDSGEDEYSFCLVKIGVLQFCDFYCGLLAIWVTLVAMAHIPQKYVSLLHMFGAILLAFGTELNKQSLWVFLAPALTGICLISTSWGMRCRNTRKCFPAKRYLTIFMPFGMVLVMVGLVCYAFLQTKQNYHIVHSIWHMVMALSIMCLLPSPKSFVPKC